ncbi:fusicoccadiene synthase [Karstenula rhodostoma CBS 690.94]|uniref:Terpene synthase n=1 Tax=Karstenula rhodostoma CBS 690.94 TaxID=1392251 RepID=A0A9P4PRQ5_9PLEO|nr:fusicoccadiene synthase [Karstenula rhodostoma CBS 690.94]
MDFKHSDVLGSGTYRDDGLANGIPLRIHKDPYSEIAGSLRAQRDWNSSVSPVQNYQGGLGHPYSFVCATIPECIPERLEIISYANEYAFLYDDEMENLDLKNFKEGRDDMLHVFRDEPLNEKVLDNVRPEKKLQAQILAEMMAIDRTRAITTMKAWAQFVELASRTRSEPFETLDEYLPSRAIDAGEMFWYGMLTFAMALTIPTYEFDLCMKLARPGYAAISLTNDLYSWRKEREDAEKAGQDYVFNAVWVVIQERKCTESTAIQICQEEIKRHLSEFEENIESPETKTLSRDTQAYLQAVRLSHVGNLVWSIYCPRYHRGVDEHLALSTQLGSAASRLLDTVFKFLISPFQHVFYTSQRGFLVQRLLRHKS